jgi:xanthine dehydrogenase YagS FAD-binding subunit
MNQIEYLRATSVDEAIGLCSERPDAAFLGGGTNLIDLMKYEVERPTRLVDISRLPLTRIEPLPDGGLRIGGLARNSDLAQDPRVRKAYPVLSEALLSGASPQLRNMATTGGNLLQRTRCYYFYDVAFPCNKREPGSGCSAIGGFNRIHAVLGQSEHCIATHPSDMAVAMAALGAVVQVQGPRGQRSIPLEDFHRLPGNTPHVDFNLDRDELITAVDLPPLATAARSRYLKVRDRAQFAFAVVSVAAALNVRNGSIADVRLALGGVAHKPWRCFEAEKALLGQPASATGFTEAAQLALRDARGYEHNGFKIELARRSIVRALGQLAEADHPAAADTRSRS